MLMQIEITTVCNTNCFYCMQDTLMHTHMSWECFEAILRFERRPTTLLLQGTGEPLLHPLFWKMTAYAKERMHRISIITNGSIPTEPLPYTTYQCPYLENEKMRYYFVDGTKAPCCYMIDSTKVLHPKVIQHTLAQKSVPSCCTQCGELTGVKRLYM